MIFRISEILATISDVVLMVWFIPSFLHITKRSSLKKLTYLIPALMLLFELFADYLFPGFDLVYLLGVAVFSFIFSIVVNFGKKTKFRTFLASSVFIITQLFSSSLVFAILSFFVDDINSIMQGETSVPRVIYLTVCLAARIIIYKVVLTIFAYNDPLDKKNGVFVSLYTFISAISLGLLMELAVRYVEENELTILLLLLTIILSTVISFFMVHQVQIAQRREYEYKLIAERTTFARESAKEASLIWDNIRKTRHELKNQLSVVSAKLKSGDIQGSYEYIDNLTDTVESFNDIVRSGNPLVDYLINSKLSKLDKSQVIVSGYLGNYEDIDDADLVCILGNVLDNAVEAEQKVDESKRKIELHFVNQNQNRIIVCKNAIDKSVLNENPELLTTKKQAPMHGLGHKIIQETVEKYYGFVNFSELDGMFCVQVVLPQK